MDNKKFKQLSALNLCIAYLLSLGFLFLILLSFPKPKEEVVELVSIPHTNPIPTERTSILKENSLDPVVISPPIVYQDHLQGRVLRSDPHFVEVKEDEVPLVWEPKVSVNDPLIYENSIYNEVPLEHTIPHSRVDSVHRGRDIAPARDGGRLLSGPSLSRGEGRTTQRRATKDKTLEETISFEEAVARLDPTPHSVPNLESPTDQNGLDVGSLVPAKKNDTLLGDVSNFNSEGLGAPRGGELYAYNFPTKGVGAGIGSGGLGASAGQAAGLGAGIGEGILNGEAVPTLGGVGDGAKTAYGEPSEPAGVGGLVGGAGAGGAAGLTQGYITPKLGVGVGNGIGGVGGNGNGRAYNYNHLPKDGALHIMMHVDGSGSILNTRKQLEVMKNTLLKTALLPYYNNDEGLYNKRVTIVDGSGERTFKFFSQASSKENVLAVVFQDEAQPAYHLPNFNKKPEDHYLQDLNKLKNNLSGHKGVYRGIMFQVDRGKTFARSFKEFVHNAWQGEGYLSDANLKKYHWRSNASHIKNKDGIVFSDEYHAKDDGDPEYYLNLLFNAAQKVGLDLKAEGAGLTDGKSIE